MEKHRLTPTQFKRWFANRNVSVVIMEACGSAHHWARWLNGLGIEMRLLPAQYVRAYVRRNKTDAAALLEAARASDMRPVRVKSVEQQALQGLHRTWQPGYPPHRATPITLPAARRAHLGAKKNSRLHASDKYD